jgi:hypothetical protein
MTCQATLDALPEWRLPINTFALPSCLIVLCSDKSDLVSPVASETEEQFANRKELASYLTSAANREGIEMRFWRSLEQ